MPLREEGGTVPRHPFETVTLIDGQTVQLLGYLSFAALASEIRIAAGGKPLTAKAVRGYSHKDRRRGEPHLLPRPVAEGENGLPLWLPAQVHNWVRTRPGPGNHTSGDERRRTVA